MATLTQNLHIEPHAGVRDLVFHLYQRFLPYESFPGPASLFGKQLFETTKDRIGAVPRRFLLRP